MATALRQRVDAAAMIDDISRTAVASVYGLPTPLEDATWTRIWDAWRPHRMWASVLIHTAWRRSQASTPRYRQRPKRSPKA